ncbi:MAG: hypothetical protein ACXWJC_03120 [Croceibacterium sp.]
MTGRLLIAYALMALLAVAAAAWIWWLRHNAPSRIQARLEVKRREKSAARALALMSAGDGGDQT